MNHFGLGLTVDCDSGMQTLSDSAIEKFIDSPIVGHASNCAAQIMGDCLLGVCDTDFGAYATEEETHSTYFQKDEPAGEEAVTDKRCPL